MLLRLVPTGAFKAIDTKSTSRGPPRTDERRGGGVEKQNRLFGGVLGMSPLMTPAAAAERKSSALFLEVGTSGSYNDIDEREEDEFMITSEKIQTL
jgi:hypothetical protein